MKVCDLQYGDVFRFTTAPDSHSQVYLGAVLNPVNRQLLYVCRSLDDFDDAEPSLGWVLPEQSVIRLTTPGHLGYDPDHDEVYEELRS